jgi:hypothetical protein
MLARGGTGGTAGATQQQQPLTAASAPAPHHGHNAAPPASQQASASDPHMTTNPLKRLTASTLRHLHLHPPAAGGGANGGGGGGSAAAAAAQHPHHSANVQHSAPSAGASVRQRALGDMVIGDDPSSAVAVPSAAARLYVDMNADEIGEEARRAASLGWAGGGGGGGLGGGGLLSRLCRSAGLFQTVHPLDPRYRAWWTATIGAALATGWLEPFRIAFLETRSQGLVSAPNLWINALSVAVLALFCVDICVSFFVGYYDADGILVMRRGAVAWHYIT